jgi:hypothetical protein
MHYNVPIILPKGERFRTCARNAIRIWKHAKPKEAKAFIEECCRYKDSYKRSGGTDDEGDMPHMGKLPLDPVNLLRMDPEFSKRLFDCEVGYGNKTWDLDNELLEIFWSEIPKARTSKYAGITGTSQKGHI